MATVKKIHDIDEQIPDPSLVLAQRLDDWLHCVNILYDYVDTYTTLTKKEIQSYEKIKKSISALPRFTRYDGTTRSGSPATPIRIGTAASDKIVLPKGTAKVSTVSRSSTMGSSEIVAGALRSASFASSEAEALPSYSANAPGASTQQKLAQTPEQFAPHTFGVDGLFEMLRAKNEMNLVSLSSLDKQIKEHVLPVFKNLVSEVSSYRKKFNNTVEKNEKTAKKISKAKQKLVKELEECISGYEDNSKLILKASTGHIANDVVPYDRDPFLVKKFFFKNLNEQFTLENNLIDQLVTMKEEIFALEVKIVDTIKKMVVLFHNFQISHYEELINNLTLMNEEFSQLDDKLEISKFLSSNADEKNDDMFLLLSSKLPVDSKLIETNLKKDINYTSVADPKLLATINHDSTIPILKDLITYSEVRKLSLKDRMQKDHVKYDYFALTKLRYLFVFGTDNEIQNAVQPTASAEPGSNLVTATDKDFFKGELEPSLIFYLPKCSVIDDVPSDEEITSTSSGGSGMSRTKSMKSKFGSIKKKLHHDSDKGLSSQDYQIKFVGIDLNHKILSKFSKSAHKRTIVMKFRTKEQYQLWNNLIRDMSGDLEEVAEDFDGHRDEESFEVKPEDRKFSFGVMEEKIAEDQVAESKATKIEQGSPAAKNTEDDLEKEEEELTGKGIISDSLNERFVKSMNLKRGGTFASSINMSDENLSEAGADSIFELREAIKQDKIGKDVNSNGRFLEHLN